MKFNGGNSTLWDWLPAVCSVQGEIAVAFKRLKEEYLEDGVGFLMEDEASKTVFDHAAFHTRRLLPRPQLSLLGRTFDNGGLQTLCQRSGGQKAKATRQASRRAVKCALRP